MDPYDVYYGCIECRHCRKTYEDAPETAPQPWTMISSTNKMATHWKSCPSAPKDKLEFLDKPLEVNERATAEASVLWEHYLTLQDLDKLDDDIWAIEC